MRRARSATRLVTAAGMVLLGLRAFVACGARTPLDVNPPPDTGVDAARDVFVQDVLPDIDAGFDASPDVLPDVPPDVPMIDVNPLPDVVVPGCEDAGATQIYLMTGEYILYSFYPPTLALTPIGMISCPDPMGTKPFSMAVDREGTAFVVYQDGNLFQVSTATAACIGTPYSPDQDGISTFGMGYVGNLAVDAGETLYVSADNFNGTGTGPTSLGTINTTSFTLSIVGQANLDLAELTGTGDGRLFAFWPPNGQTPSGSILPGAAVSQLDPATAQVIATTPLPTVSFGSGWAFAFWGGDFYLFTAPNGAGSQITRFDPIANTVTVVATMQNTIVGAGVSTCAPMQ